MQKTIDHFKFIGEQNFETLKIIKGFELGYFQRCCAGLLERMTFATDANILLMEKLNTNAGLEFSIGIILRCLFSDGLIVLNIFDEYRKCIEDNKREEIYNILNTVGHKFLSDGLEQTSKYIMQGVSIGYRQSQDEMNADLKKFVTKYQEYFEAQENEGKPPQLKNRPETAFQLFDKLKNSEISNLRNIYDKYNLFSKYDHFGVLYFEAISRPYNSKLETISKSAEQLLFIDGILHFLISEFGSNEDLKKQLDILYKYMEANLPIK